MELIPILSTIILVATISTFILAIGAYILYKIREGKQSRTSERKTESIEAEIIKPKQKVFIEDVLKPETKETPVGERNTPIYIPVDQTEFRAGKYSHITEVESEKPVEIKMPESKFVKVTTQGYILPDEEKDNGVIGWR